MVIKLAIWILTTLCRHFQRYFLLVLVILFSCRPEKWLGRAQIFQIEVIAVIRMQKWKKGMETTNSIPGFTRLSTFNIVAGWRPKTPWLRSRGNRKHRKKKKQHLLGCFTTFLRFSLRPYCTKWTRFLRFSFRPYCTERTAHVCRSLCFLELPVACCKFWSCLAYFSHNRCGGPSLFLVYFRDTQFCEPY